MMVKHCPGVVELADLMTKQLPAPRVKMLQALCGLRPPVRGQRNVLKMFIKVLNVQISECHYTDMLNHLFFQSSSDASMILDQDNKVARNPVVLGGECGDAAYV